MRSMVPLALCCLCTALSPLAAQDQRDEEIFGSTPREATPPAPAVSEKMNRALMDSLQVGGRLEIRSTTGREEQQSFPKASFQQAKAADLYLDSRPNKDLRAFLRTRWTELAPPPASTESQTACSDCVQTQIDELWLRWNWVDQVFVTFGKQRLKWGSSRIWNPSDFTARDIRDPLALVDRRLGQNLLKIHIPQEKQGHNYYAVLQFDDAARNDDIGLGLRGEFSVGPAGELAISAQTRRSSPQRLALDLSTALGPIDLTVEAAGSRRQDRRFFRGELDVSTLRLPEAYEDEARWFKQAVLGLRHTWRYSDTDNLSYGVEYFWNELGYEERELALYSLVLGESQALYAGRQYVGVYAVLMAPGDWNETAFYLNGLSNLNDRTTLVRLTGTWELIDDASFEAYVSTCAGDYGEFCFRLPETYRQLAQLPGFPQDIRETVLRLPTRKTNVTAGAALTLEF